MCHLRVAVPQERAVYQSEGHQILSGAVSACTCKYTKYSVAVIRVRVII